MYTRFTREVPNLSETDETGKTGEVLKKWTMLAKNNIVK